MRALTVVAVLGALVAAGAEPAPKFSSESLYQLGSSFLDATGKKVELSSLAGHPVLLSMVYTNCQATCPLTIARMKAIASKLDAKTKASARFVLVSFDPKRDTPARLATVAKERALPAPAWVLLTGTDDAVRELAAALSFKYQPVEGGEFVHSTQLTVLGPDGVIRAQVSGDEATPEAAIQAMQR